MKTLKLIGLLGILLAMGFIFTGCSGGGGDSDTWSNITSIEQVNGTWKGSFSETQTMKKYIESGGQTWTAEMQESLGDMKIKLTVDMIVTINSVAKNITGTQSVTLAFSGGKIKDIWPELKYQFSGPGVSVNDSNYSVSWTDSINETINESDFAGFQINQNKKKIRFPASDMGFESGKDFILTKQ